MEHRRGQGNNDGASSWLASSAAGTEAAEVSEGTDMRRSPVPQLFMPLGDGTHKLPVKAGVRKVVGKEAGDTVTVWLQERIGAPAARIA
jgi:uncharacterized protein DUF1905